jgi:5-methylcytosine-specific restriction enzyme subunit McrC
VKREIPIRNLYYLLSYAWNCYIPGDEKYLGTDNFSNAANLMSQLLDVALEILERRGYTRDYQTFVAAYPGVRGRLLLKETISSGKLFTKKTFSQFDDYTFDNPLNQIIKASLRNLLNQADLNDHCAMLIRRKLSKFSEVSDLKLNKDHFSAVRLHTHTSHYRLALELCRLIFDCQTVSTHSRELFLSSFLDDALKMDRIFEKFVKNFYSFHLKTARVSSPIFQWSVEAEDQLFIERVPELRTDVAIDQNGRRLIIDAKFYQEAMKASFGKFKFRRDHLSQLMEYLRGSIKQISCPTNGMLLYPTVDEKLDNVGRIEGFEIRVATVDLSATWNEIELKLLAIAQESLSSTEVVA